MTSLYRSVLNDLATVFDQIEKAAVDRAVTEIAAANKITLYGVTREGLQIKGFAMRLFHLGLRAAVVRDMTTPHLGAGDLLILSAGPGGFLPWKR
jgi:6-phospho-3-hexuloisomerase